MKTKPLTYMDLAEAIAISKRPGNKSLRAWERALRILVRWASEPCTEREYEVRRKACGKVYACIRRAELMEETRRARHIKLLEGIKFNKPIRRIVHVYKSTSLGR